jgi:Holliday junction resolvase RusA-like endonuclease
MIVFTLPFPISINAMFSDGKHRRFRSQRYDTWIMEATAEIYRQRPKKITGPVTLLYEIQEGRDNRKRDLGNLEKCCTDLLVSHGIIQADDGSIVREIKLKWNAEVEGVRVTVAPLFNRVPEASPETNNNERAASGA